jgi:hypothetical protein
VRHPAWFRIALACIAASAVPLGAQPSVPSDEPVVTTQPDSQTKTEATVEPAQWWSALQLDVMVLTGYTWNAHEPASRRNSYRVFDFDHDVIKLDAAEIVLQRDAGDDGVGFRVDVAAGSSIPRVVRSRGLDMGDLDVHQAFLRYVAPVADGLTVDAGKFVTPAGYEVIDGYDGINDNMSRSLLFGYAIPFTHTGVRVGLGLAPGLTVTGYLVNGWDVAVDNNAARTVGLHVMALPFESLTISGCVFRGAERDSSTSDARTLVDLVAIWKASSMVTAGINVDFASETGATSTGSDATWSGLAGYLRIAVSERFALAARAEVFDDPDGVRTGVPQTLQSYTLTPELRVADGLVFRADLRIDRSNVALFGDADDPSATQPTIGIQAVATF